MHPLTHPLSRWVLANDLLPQAAANIQHNIDWNDLGASAAAGSEASTSQHTLDGEAQNTAALGDTTRLGKVRVSQGDCW